MKISMTLSSATMVALTLSIPFAQPGAALADTHANSEEDVTLLIDPDLRGLVQSIPPQFDLITRETLDEVRLLSDTMFQPPGLENITVTTEEVPTEDGKIKVNIYRS